MTNNHQDPSTLSRSTNQDSDNDIYRLLVENSLDGMALFENKELVYASPSMNEIFGCKDFYQFKTYQDVLDRVHPDDLPKLGQLVNDHIKHKRRHQKYPFQFKREDGSYCWIENSVTRIYDSQGNNVTNIVTSRDISENKKNENELFQQKEVLKTIAENTTALIYTKDLNGTYLFANKALEEVYKIETGELAGKKDTDITDKDTAARFRNNDLAVIKSGKPIVFEETQELEDGMHTAISVKVPIFDNHGNVESICGITTDITDRKKAEELLRVLNEKLEMALTAGNLGLWEWYVDGNRVDWFGKSARLFGIDEKEFDGSTETIGKLMHPDDRDKGTIAFDKAIKEGVVFSSTYRVFWPDGSEHWLHSYGNPVYDENGQAFKVVGTTVDITSEIIAKNKIVSQNEELIRVNAMKDKLFSIVSHDLKNPLNSMLGFIQLLNLNYLNESPEIIGRYISFISKSANAMAGLLHTLSQWSRSQRGKIRVSPVIINPLNLVDEISSLFVANQHNKNLRLDIKIKPGNKAYADEEMVKTILRNYLNNAIKFSHPGGKITISTNADDGYCVFRITDDGVGIDPDRLKQLFSLSSYDPEPGTEGEKGTGLGLIICKEMAALNHGKVWAESKKGEGSDFYFSVPANKNQWEKSISSHPTNS